MELKMILKSSKKAVSPKAENIRNTEKPLQTFTVTKITFLAKELTSVLGFCVTSFCAGCSFRSENQHLWSRISNSPFSSYVKMKTKLQNILSHVTYSIQGNNASTYLELIRNSRTLSTSIRFS